VAVLAVLWCAYPLIPPGAVRAWVYDVFAIACIGVGVWGASRLRTRVRGRWMLVLAGFGGLVLGDGVFSIEQHVLHVSFYPVPSDAVYLGSYLVLALSLLRLVRAPSVRSDATPLLEAAIMTVGSGIVIATFVVAPIAADSSLSVLGRAVASAYPAADVLLLGVMLSVWTVSGTRALAFRLLVVALLATLGADIVWNVVAMTDPEAVTPAWMDLLWLLGYLAAAAAACTRSAGQIDRPQTHGQQRISARARMLVLGCGLLLPGLTLFLDALIRQQIPWQLVSVGSMILSLLVLLRMGLLLKTVEVQSVRLTALARNDALTGIPNRRSWDYELGRAMQRAREQGSALSIAMIDLDHFKRFNDEFGHQAGDRLLREAVAAWCEVLEPDEVLARYGGEEFGLILPGLDAEQASRRLQAMQELTPDGQSFSAGIAVARRDHDPDLVVALADRALYEAKRAGRRCARVADSLYGEEALPPVHIALQPIVDLETGLEVGRQAIRRFPDGTSASILTRAHRDGYGHELEASALRAALRRSPADGYLSINLSLPALGSPVIRAALAEDLHGIVIELEHRSDVDIPEHLAEVIEGLKERGARIAIADWAGGFFDADRIARVRADAITLDRRSLASLSDRDQQAVMTATVRWAHDLGLKICAHGIETAEQWRSIAPLGFDYGRGVYFDDAAARAEDASGASTCG